MDCLPQGFLASIVPAVRLRGSYSPIILTTDTMLVPLPAVPWQVGTHHAQHAAIACPGKTNLAGKSYDRCSRVANTTSLMKDSVSVALRL